MQEMFSEFHPVHERLLGAAVKNTRERIVNSGIIGKGNLY